MMPIAPLMLEHRLIERMLNATKNEIRSVELGKGDPRFIDLAIDFITTYADRCHQGKEEEILFHVLAAKDLSDSDRRTMDELIEDHRRSRAMTDRLSAARQRWGTGDSQANAEIARIMKEFVVFYRNHIEREDRHFFVESMAYFTHHEQDDMFEAFAEFDRKVIHEKYRSIVEKIEGRREIDD